MLQRLLLAQPGRGEQGLTLLVALVAAVVIVSAAASLASRTLSTQMGSSRLGDSREAREAAEAGLATVISELNRQRNRQLLTADVGMKAWSNPTNEAALTNVCSDVNESTPDPATLAIGQGTPQPVPGSNGMLRYTLLAMEVSTADRTSSFRSGSDGTVTTSGTYNPRRINPDESGAFGYLRLEVKGEAKNKQGTLIASSTVVRDFKLIPKSCRRSPAAPYGNQVRASLLRPLVVGFNGGGFTNISSGSKLTDPLQFEQAVCLIVPGATRCGGIAATTVFDKPVIPMTVGANLNDWLPASRRYPCSSSATACSSNIAIKTAQYNYIGINGAKIPRVCKVAIPKDSPAETYTPTVGDTCSTLPIKDHCITLPEPAPSTEKGFHCRLQDITIDDGADLYVDTSNGPLYLYVNRAWSTATAPITFATTSPLRIIHSYCNPAPVGSVCTKPLTPADSPTGSKPVRATIFTDLSGTLELSNKGSIEGFFLWAPLLNVLISNASSTPAFIGTLWVNDLNLGPGSLLSFWPDLGQAAGSASPGTAYPQFSDSAGQPPSPFRLAYDVVARPCSSGASVGGAACARGVIR